MQRIAELEVAARFCGPPGCANGGYVAGLLAAFGSEPMEVRLRAPPPLGVRFNVHASADGFELRQGEVLLASAVPAAVDLAVPPPITLAAARAAAAGFAGLSDNTLPRCFVCGPARAVGDGLRIFAGPLVHQGHAMVAAPWVPDATLAGTRARVRPEFLSAALDCPGYFAVVPDTRMMLLGSFTCRIDGEVAVGEPCVVAGWSLGGEGRKRRAATVIYGADGEPRACAIATWVEPKLRA